MIKAKPAAGFRGFPDNLLIRANALAQTRAAQLVRALRRTNHRWRSTAALWPDLQRE